MYVVTEYGTINLKGKSIPDRATAMISIAHPENAVAVGPRQVVVLTPRLPRSDSPDAAEDLFCTWGESPLLFEGAGSAAERRFAR